jgi:hypothetical protein
LAEALRQETDDPGRQDDRDQLQEGKPQQRLGRLEWTDG